MNLRLTVFWMFVGVFAIFGLYTVKYRVQELKVEVAATETQLREEKKTFMSSAPNGPILIAPSACAS